VGGHCIPVDPYYLIEYAHDHGFDHKFLSLARNINERMPEFTVELLEEILGDTTMSLKGAKVALLGLSYKANVGDDRESPSLVIQKLLEEAGADLVSFDPYISAKSNVQSLEAALQHADAVIVATGHDEFRNLRANDLSKHHVKIVIDGRNVLKELKSEFREADIVYRGIGV
jgi:nucleotide sugar dehydrogenase